MIGICKTVVDGADLVTRLSRPDWTVVDCRYDPKIPGRGYHEYLRAHIPGAHYAHIDGHMSGPMYGDNGRHPLPAPATFAAHVARWDIRPSSKVVAYDDSGGIYAARFWWMLRWIGHRHVAVLDGGWSRWVAEGRAVEAGARVADGGQTYPWCVDRHAAVEARDIEQRLDTLLIIDARSADRMRGMGEDQDPVGGHIPGARNRPYRDNLNADGLFHSPSELRGHFTELIGAHPLARVVHQCGSGITACHNLLAMEHAGLRGSRLYPGSWSEWCAVPRRPMNRFCTQGAPITSIL